MQHFSVLGLTLLLSVLLGACAGNHLRTVDRQVVGVDEFLTHINALTEEVIEADDDEFSEDQVQKIARLNEQLNQRLADVSEVEELSDKERDEIFAMSEDFYATVFPDREDTRTICRNEAPTGSRIPETRCTTVKDRRQETEQTQDRVREMQHRPQQTGGDG
ncbi:hypothetical protein [Natronospira sp.]